METLCEPGKINISGETYRLIKNHFECENRGNIEVKGKGKIEMYFVKHAKIKLDSKDLARMQE
jgi:adenylate cyclase